MSTAEITAYLKGVEIGREAERIHVPPETVPFNWTMDDADPLFAAWRRLGTDQFRKWVNRGVYDAWQQ